MSQKKVDAYKEAKKTRKQDVAKQKKLKKIQTIAGIAIGVALAALLVFGLVITFRNISTGEISSDVYKETQMNLPDYASIAGTEEETEEESTTETEETEEEKEPEESQAE